MKSASPSSVLSSVAQAEPDSARITALFSNRACVYSASVSPCCQPQTITARGAPVHLMH